MTTPPARTQNKVHLGPKTISTTSSASARFAQIIPDALYAISLCLAKELLLSYEVGTFWVLMRVLACGGVVVMIWGGVSGKLGGQKHTEWSVLATASVLLLVQQAGLLVALSKMSSIRVILLTHFSSVWIRFILSPLSNRKTASIGLALLLSFTSDIQFSLENSWSVLPAYCALATHALTTAALEHTHGLLAPSLGPTLTIAISTLGASVLALPLYVSRSVLLGFPSTPVLPLSSLATLPILAFSILFLPSRSWGIPDQLGRALRVSYPSTFAFATIFGFCAFSWIPTWTDALVSFVLFYGIYQRSSQALHGPTLAPTFRLLRSYLKTILMNPESRKIFYFLMLNMSYMLVQILYGVWTNSLGLISDAIHMAFDCMAIGVGLFASLMATWAPNEQFTYGYGRVETLSGFANGIFLILISVFIVFEAIQRLLNPPDMNTSQLLLVSSLGLAVNLFGMFATGGHHHGGHSHSHSHSQTPGDERSHSSPAGHDHNHSHGSHSHSHSPPPQSRSHSYPLSSMHSSPPTTPQLAQLPSTIQLSSDPFPSPANYRELQHTHSHSTQPLTNGHSHTDDEHVHLSAPPVPSSRMRRTQGPYPENEIEVQSLTGYTASTTLSTPSPLQQMMSPITPNYHFGHDDHFDTHHTSNHAPNLHDHSHAHDRSREGHSHNMRGVFLHVLADTLGSVGVIISTLLIQFYGWTGFDPIASLFIAILIAASVVPLVTDTGKILCLDVGENDTKIQKALSELSRVEGLAHFTSARFWPKDASSQIGSIHIQLAPSASSLDPSRPHSSTQTTYVKIDRVIERVDVLLRSRIESLEELTIQVEESTRL